MNTLGGRKQKSQVLKDLKRSSHGRRSFSMSALSLNLDDDDDQNAVSPQGATDEDDEDGNRNSNNNGFSIFFHGSDRYTFSSLSSSSSGSPLWSSACTADSSPPSATRSLQAAVPFSWEDKPGVPSQQSLRRSSQRGDAMDSFGSLELRPPPPYFFSSGGRSPEHHRSSSGRRPKKTDDPFLMAMVECTKQGIKDDRAKKQGYSCMKTCSIRDAQVRVPRSRAAVSDSHKDLGNPRRHGINGIHVRSSSSVSECKSHAGRYGVAGHQSELTLMASEGNQGMVDTGAHAERDPLILRPGYWDNRGNRDFRSTKAVNQKKEPLTFMDWIRCADVELYQSLLDQ